MNSPHASGLPPIGSQTTISNAELEAMRRQSIRVLDSVAAALEAAGHQKRTLLAEVHLAHQTLRDLANERETAEADLAACRAQLNHVATKLEHAEVQRRGILREVDDLRSASLNRTRQHFSRKKSNRHGSHQQSLNRPYRGRTVDPVSAAIGCR